MNGRKGLVIGTYVGFLGFSFLGLGFVRQGFVGNVGMGYLNELSQGASSRDTIYGEDMKLETVMVFEVIPSEGLFKSQGPYLPLSIP